MGLDVLLAGSLGALLVFAFNVARDRVRRRRELRGIARLLHTELLNNSTTLQGFYKTPGRVLSPALGTVTTETWESVRVQMAAMMRADDLGSIVYYYLFLQEIKNMPSIVHGGSHKAAVELIESQLSVLRDQEPNAMEVALAYSNLNGPLGWIRLRRRMATYRKSVADAKRPGSGATERPGPTSAKRNSRKFV